MGGACLRWSGSVLRKRRGAHAGPLAAPAGMGSSGSTPAPVDKVPCGSQAGGRDSWGWRGVGGAPSSGQIANPPRFLRAETLSHQSVLPFTRSLPAASMEHGSAKSPRCRHPEAPSGEHLPARLTRCPAYSLPRRLRNILGTETQCSCPQDHSLKQLQTRRLCLQRKTSTFQECSENAGG